MKKEIFIEVPIEKLQLDPDNPRLPEKYRKAETNEVLNWMLTDATLIELMASIAENGFFPGEPIIVIPEKDKFIVIEGNRRLAALLLLKSPEIAETYSSTVRELASTASERGTLPKDIWVYVVDRREEVANYLAFRHVSGVKQWPVISKARYLAHIYRSRSETGPVTYKELAKEIGSRSTYVRRLLAGYTAFEHIQHQGYYGIQGLDEESFDLTLITDALTMHSNIAKFAGVNINQEPPLRDFDPDRFRELTFWLYQKLEDGRTRVGDNRRLRILNQVLGSRSSAEAFLEGATLDEANKLTGETLSSIGILLRSSENSLKSALTLTKRLNEDDFKGESESIFRLLSGIENVVNELREVFA